MWANNGSLQCHNTMIARMVRLEWNLLALTRKNIVGVPVQSERRCRALNLIDVDTDGALPSFVLYGDEESYVDVLTCAINILRLNHNGNI